MKDLGLTLASVEGSESVSLLPEVLRLRRCVLALLLGLRFGSSFVLSGSAAIESLVTSLLIIFGLSYCLGVMTFSLIYDLGFCTAFGVITIDRRLYCPK